MAFSPQQLIDFLPKEQAICHLGFSGGVDSHVLLHALCKLLENNEIQISLKVIHVHHGLSSNADDWADHCRLVCQHYGLPLEVSNVHVELAGQGLENAARNARLSVFEEKLAPGEFLLTAHHLDDQLETMLFRMMRGTGLRGLSGMAESRPLGSGLMVRPLLTFSRAELVEYAKQEELVWIEDESNKSLDFDRNYLRQKVMPQLSARWPGYQRSWQRLAKLADEGEILQCELGQQDLLKVQDAIHRLDILAMQEFSLLRQRNIVRSWFLFLEQEHAIAVPDYKTIQRIFDELIPAAEDASPLVSWEKSGTRVEIRRYAGHIYLLLAPAETIELTSLSWDTSKPLELPGHLGRLTLVENSEEGLIIAPGDILEVGFKKGGEKVKPAGRKTRSLKKTLQDYRVPPWLREQTPIVYRSGEMIALADLFICDKHCIKRNQDNCKKMFKIQWRKSDLHCGY